MPNTESAVSAAMEREMTAAEKSHGRTVESYLFDFDGLMEAVEIVRKVVGPTPQIDWPMLHDRTGAEVWVKHENHLPTGAFKMRGGLVMANSIASGRNGPLPAGIITASAGNHGLSQTFAGLRAGLKVTIVVPLTGNAEKIAAIRAMGAEVITDGHDFTASYEISRKIAKDRGLLMIEPFHPDLIRGVATYAYELFSAVHRLDTVYVPIGLGSGICGMIRTRDLLGLKTKVVGVVSKHSATYALSFDAKRPVPTETADTIADGLSVRVPNPFAVEIINGGADRIIQVDDDEIREAARIYHTDTHNMAEGAGVAALAGLMQERDKMQGKRVAVIMSGANISRPLLAEILK